MGMLEFVALESPKSWLEICSEFDPMRETWVVADLQSKMAIQQELFKKFKIVPEQAVLRASEFWQNVLKRTGGEWIIISTTFARAFLIEKLEQEEEAWLKVPGAHKTLMEYIQQLLPIFMENHSEDLFENWIKENSDAMIRWGRWYYSARKYIEIFISRSWILESWVPHVLSSTESDWTWDRRVTVDLGTQLTLAEALMFKKLYKNQSVRVLYPESIFQLSSSSVQRAYKSLDDKYFENLNSERVSISIANNPSADTVLDENKLQLLRFSTSLSEVKDLCAQLRIWLQEGGSPHNIAIYAPNIETYWPVLFPYLKAEGIPVQKNRVVRAHSFLSVMSWVSRLKIEMKQITSEDLELEVYSSRSRQVEVDYSQFKKMYSLILSPDHIKRIANIADRYQFNLDLHKPLRLDDFLLWAIPFYSGEDSCPALEPLFHNLLGKAPTNIKLQAKTWLLFFEEIVSKTEILLVEGDPCGVVLENIKYNHRTSAQFCYFLGLSESQIFQSRKVGLSESERNAIERDLGYILSDVNLQDIEFDAAWTLKDEGCRFVVSFSQTGFSGEPDSPSPFWLKLAIGNKRNLDELNIPRTSKWDYIQQSNLKDAKIRFNQDVSKFIDRDLGTFNFDPVETTLSRLSVSRIERYTECSLIFLFESLMKLRDQKALDLDIDAMDRGQLQHKVLQNLMEIGSTAKERIRLMDDQENLWQLIEKSRRDLKLTFFDEKSWNRVRHNTFELACRFLNFEKDWEDTYPGVKNLGREVELKAFWNQEAKDFQRDPVGIEFNAVIDRVDGDSSGNVIVLDYKSSGSQLTSFTAWIDNNKFQLPIYSYLLQKGFGDINVKEVMGMGYYILKDLTRSKGLWCEEGDGVLFPVNKRSRNSMTKYELNQFWDDIKNQLHRVISEIQSGKFVANPRDVSKCDKCSWRKICRAPHLM